VEEGAQIYDRLSDLHRKDTPKSNREQLSHNDMAVMGLHEAHVEFQLFHVRKPSNV
jgi:hypothetical protein